MNSFEETKIRTLYKDLEYNYLIEIIDTSKLYPFRHIDLCPMCQMTKEDRFLILINPEPSYPNSSRIKYYHISCFTALLQKTKELTDLDYKKLKEHNDVLESKLTERSKLNLFSTIANDYGMPLDQFIERTISYYKEKNCIPIKFINEMDFQKYIELNLSKIDDRYIFNSHQIGINDGEMDILAYNGKYPIIIEVKLIATFYTLSQILFYIHSFCETKNFNREDITGIIIGHTVQPNLIHSCEQYNNDIKDKYSPIRVYEFNGADRSFNRRI